MTDDDVVFTDRSPQAEDTGRQPKVSPPTDPEATDDAGVEFSDQAATADAFDPADAIDVETPALQEHAPDYEPAADPTIPADPQKVEKAPILEPLPEKRVAKRPEVHHARAGVAVCPECQAKNEHSARMCLRCGASIAAPIPGKHAAAPVAGILGAAHAPAGPRTIDPELIPQHVRDGWAQEAEERHQRRLEWLARRAQAKYKVLVPFVLWFALAGIVLAAPLGNIKFLFMLGEGAVGFAVAWMLFEQRMGRMQGLLFAGSVSMAIGVVKAILVFALFGDGNQAIAVAWFLFLVGYVGFSVFAGYFFGMAMEFKTLDQEV